MGCVGFGGPPAHVALLRDLCVTRRRWLTDHDFEDAIAATNLLPGPASTQLAIFCAWRVRGAPGAVVGGLAFMLPGLAMILALAVLFLAGSPPEWVLGAGAGAGAAVAAVAVHAGVGLLPGSWRRAGGGAEGGSAGGEVGAASARRRGRWVAYLVAGLVVTVAVGPWLVLVLLACGLVEAVWRGAHGRGGVAAVGWPVGAAVVAAATGGLGALGWTALKVGALSYGGGFVIVPLMQADAVGRHGWMTDGEFLSAVALGQVTPGPVVLTIAVVGFAAAGVGGALLATAVAFLPSFALVLAGARHFDRLRSSAAVRAFLDGAGPAAIGAILGAAVPLALGLTEAWQVVVLAAAALALLVLRLGVVITLLGAGAAGVALALAGAPLPG